MALRRSIRFIIVGLAAALAQTAAFQQPARATDIPLDGWISRTGNVLNITGPLSTGLSKTFMLRLVEASVYADGNLPIFLVLNSVGGREDEARVIREVIGLFRSSGEVFESRVNYAQVCDLLCWSIIEAAGPNRIISGVVWTRDDERSRAEILAAIQRQQQGTDYEGWR